MIVKVTSKEKVLKQNQLLPIPTFIAPCPKTPKVVDSNLFLMFNISFSLFFFSLAFLINVSTRELCTQQNVLPLYQICFLSTPYPKSPYSHQLQHPYLHYWLQSQNVLADLCSLSQTHIESCQTIFFHQGILFSKNFFKIRLQHLPG